VNASNLIKVDVALWTILLVVVWSGPEIVIKIAVSLLVVAQIALLCAVSRLVS